MKTMKMFFVTTLALGMFLGVNAGMADAEDIGTLSVTPNEDIGTLNTTDEDIGTL